MATLSYFAAEQAMQTRIYIALATVIVYGMSDAILNYVLGFACNCENHQG